MTDEWQAIRGLYPAWARELIAHPEKDGIFLPGKDIVDSRTGWILPCNELAKLVPPSDLRGMKKALFIEPAGIVEDKGRVVVLPATIVVLHPFIQEDAMPGRVHEATRILLAIEPRTYDETRRFYRPAGVGVRPLARGRSRYNVYDRHFIDSTCRPGELLGVAVEASRE
jgi:hypothetical protein